MSNSSPETGQGNGPGISCRLAHAQELPRAIKLILSDGRNGVGASQIAHFVETAAQRGIDLSQTWVAESSGRLLYAVLPIPNPGRTMLVLAPTDPAPSPAAGMVIDRVCDLYAAHDTHLAQVLLDPNGGSAKSLFAQHRFKEIAELIYLNASIHRAAAPPPLPVGLAWKTYSPQTHTLFEQAILQTYRQSLDCPGLNGLRDIADVIQGHQATGEYNPDFWHLLHRGEQALGVLLLSPMQQTDAVELVYLGLAPEARGQGLGDIMMKQANAMVLIAHRRRLTLAVDSINQPALKLYYRHGMHQVMRKIAMIRDLRTGAAR